MKTTACTLICSALLMTGAPVWAEDKAAAPVAPVATAPAPSGVKVIETITDGTKGAPMGEVIESNRLTEDALKSFYDTSKRIHLKPYNEYLAFLNRYTSSDVQIISNVTSNMPGMPTKKQTITMDKAKFIDSLPESYKFSQGASLNHKLVSVKIAEDGQTAAAQDVTMISTVMPIPGSEKTLQVESQSTCDDNFKVATGSQPQMTKSVCKTDVYFFSK